jgi:hypothetical protein
MVKFLVGEDGRSDPNRNIYRVLDDDYVPVRDRTIAEEEPEISPQNLQSGRLEGGSGLYEPPRSRGSGTRTWAMAAAILLVALIISAGLVSGWVNIGTATDSKKVTVVEDVKIGNCFSLLPSDGSEFHVNNVTLAWSATANATGYEIMLDTSPNFLAPVKDLRTNSTFCTFHLNDGGYYWKVMAFGENTTSNWTNTRTFSVQTVVGVPQLLSPDQDAILTNQSNMFKWATVDLATIYQLQVDDDRNFSSPAIDILTRASSYNTTALMPNSTYYWRVLASNDNNKGVWSSASSFFKGFQYILRDYSWTYSNPYRSINDSFSMTLNISGESYYAQQQQNREATDPYVMVDYAARVNSTDIVVKQAAADIKADALAKGYDREDTLNLALSFVQSIPYGLDLNTTGFEDYARYPIETLVDKVGDCDCKSVLFLSLIQTTELGFDGVLLLYYGTPGHMAVGVAGSYHDRGLPFDLNFGYAYYQYLGQNYYYCETTCIGWLAGQLPSGESSAMILPA